MLVGLFAVALGAPDPSWSVSTTLGFPYFAHLDARYWWSPNWSAHLGGGVGYDFWLGVVSGGARWQPDALRHDVGAALSLRGGLGATAGVVLDRRVPVVLMVEPGLSLHFTGARGHGLLVATRFGLGLTSDLGSGFSVEPTVNIGLLEVGYVF